MARRLSYFGMLVATIALLGCSDLSTGPERDSLRFARERWAATGYHSYAFTIRMMCFCAVIDPVRVQVVNDTVVTLATNLTTGDTLPTNWVPTIARLFDFVQNGIEERAHVLRVTYDAQRGYPSEIVYDGRVEVADDELTYTVTDVIESSSGAFAR